MLNKNKKQKFLFIYLKTGGGHLAPATAIANYLSRYNNDKVEITLYDALQNANPIVKYIIEDGYRITQTKAKWIYEGLYATHKIKFISRITAYLLSRFIKSGLKNFIQNIKPDKIVIFHFFAIKPTYDIVMQQSLDIPLITVVTDPYIAHPIWFLEKNQNFIVFSNKLKKNCLRLGVSENNISVFPFMIDEKFSKHATQEDKEKIRRNLGLSDRKVLLILGGGEGIPNGTKLLNALLKSNPQYYIIFVCGRNDKLFAEVSSVKKSSTYKHLLVYKYVDFVFDLISISEAVLSKCGASTFMEILISGKIPIVNSYIWEQEKGNVKFIVENNLGIYEKRINKIPDIVSRLFSDNNYYNSFKENISKQKIENGISPVSDYILQFNNKA